ncbi:MAG: flavodoxin domain-containing protein, partial [Chloroflexota bacterium]
MKSALILYATSRGRTKKVVKRLAAKFEGQIAVNIAEIKTVNLETLPTYDLIVAGSPTYGLGDLHPAWHPVAPSVTALDLHTVSVALFALGDQRYHGKTFGGSLNHLYTIFTQTGAKKVGKTSYEAYKINHCPALAPDGSLPGLLLDEISQRHLSPQRIAAWVKIILA